MHEVLHNGSRSQQPKVRYYYILYEEVLSLRNYVAGGSVAPKEIID